MRAAAVIECLRQLWKGRTMPLLMLAAAGCAGIMVADALSGGPPGAWLAVILAAAVLLKLKPSRPALLLLCAAVFAFAHHANDRDPLREQLALAVRPGGGVPASLTGVIADAPEPDATGVNFSLPLTMERLETVTLPPTAAGAMIYVRLRDVPPGLRYGDRISLTGLLRRPLPPRNPGEFDFPAFLRRQRYSAEFEAGAAYDRITVLDHDAGSPVIAAALRSREWIGDAVTADIREDETLAATVRAMVLGTREKTPAEVEEAFVASGTMHVFAVSGLHVAMFCAILFGVLRMMRLPHGWILCIALPLVFFYVFITGLRPSAWRAAIMAAAVLGAPLFNREGTLFNGLGMAALLLLALDTQQLFQPGFTLSFGVLLALALLHPVFQRLLRPLSEGDPFLPRQLYTRGQLINFGARKLLTDSVSVSMASLLGSSLLMIYYFSLVTPIGIVANIFLVSLSLAILAVACASLVCSGLGIGFFTFCLNNCNLLLAWCSVRLAQLFAAVPYGHFQCDPARLWRGDPCEITVLELDNGGAAVHLDTPEGRHWLMDCGGKRHFFRSVRPHLSRTPVNRLDGLVLSHADAYHTGAAAAVRRVFSPEQEPRLLAGEVLPIESGVTLRCLFPPPGWIGGTADDRCAVFLLECRDTRILFMNDAGFIIEKALLESGEDLRADILVKGRHGNDFSGLPEFLNAVRPQTVVFTNADFPLTENVPNEWKQMLVAKGIPYFDQARSGAVVIRIEKAATTVRGYCDGSELEVKRPL